MKVAETAEREPLAVQNENVIQMPFGLLGFEQFKQYQLLSNPEEAPFLWLQMVEDPSVAFLVVSPFIVLPNYQPDLPEDDVEFLALEQAEDALVFNIVTLHKDGGATVNLKGPIVVNRHTLRGKQVIPTNAPKFALQHPLPVAKQP